MSSATNNQPLQDPPGFDSSKVVPLRGLAGIRTLYTMMTRLGMGRLMGGLPGRRDYDTVFGWDTILNMQRMRWMYNRGGIASRVVDAYPDAIWGRPPRLWSDTNTDWEAQFASWAKAQNLWSVLNRADKLAGLGEYAIMLIGAPGDPQTPLTRASKVLYLQPYGQEYAQIAQYDANPQSPTFGRPLYYRIYPEGAGVTGRDGTGTSNTGPVRQSFLLHSSRVLHIAQGNLEDEVFGRPRLAPVWNYLCDLIKVVGSSSESYWIMANRGMQVDVDKDMSFTADDQAALEQEVDEYFEGFRRFMRTKGVKMNAMTGQVADPSAPFDVLVTLIAGTSKIPQRILTGSEVGSLASTQDKGNWAERVEEERTNQTEPKVLLPLLNKLVALKAIPDPGAALNILWPDAYRMNPLERGQTAAQTARTAANLYKSMGQVIIKPQQQSIGPNGEQITQPAIFGDPLLTQQEARAIIGLSTDNRILALDPQI